MENKKQNTLLESFILYCHTYPRQRFWQALRNWSQYNFIYGSKELIRAKGLEDTFYKE
jgi:hypothetical protein